MLRDWLLTLFVLSPAFLAVSIVLLVLLGRVARHEPAHSVVIARPHHDGGSR
jgi:hypothetical protein